MDKEIFQIIELLFLDPCVTYVLGTGNRETSQMLQRILEKR